jgi:hypothetical protein
MDFGWHPNPAGRSDEDDVYGKRAAERTGAAASITPELRDNSATCAEKFKRFRAKPSNAARLYLDFVYHAFWCRYK